jgi:hypothetical protein
MNEIVVGYFVLTFIFDIGFFYGCCKLSSTFTLHLVISCLAIGCLQLLFLTLVDVDVKYAILYVVLVCISLIF